MVTGNGRQAVFLDRDGVLNGVERVNGVTMPPHHPAGLHILPGAAAAVHILRSSGYLTLVVSNQPDVARGIQTRLGVEAINAAIRAIVPVDDFDVCYHDTADACRCRKPLPGLLEAAASRHGVDLQRSAMVGDRTTDMRAGRAAGCATVFIAPRGTVCEDADLLAPSLLDATPWLLETLKAL